MKKIIAIALVLLLCLSFTACGAKDIEKFCDGSSLHWNGPTARKSDDVNFYATFEDGILTVEMREPMDYEDSPTGKLWIVTESAEFPYVLEGSDTVIIEGETYTYEIDGDTVHFNKDLLEIDSWWEK